MPKSRPCEQCNVTRATFICAACGSHICRDHRRYASGVNLCTYCWQAKVSPDLSTHDEREVDRYLDTLGIRTEVDELAQRLQAEYEACGRSSKVDLITRAPGALPYSRLSGAPLGEHAANLAYEYGEDKVSLTDLSPYVNSARKHHDRMRFNDEQHTPYDDTGYDPK